MAADGGVGVIFWGRIKGLRDVRSTHVTDQPSVGARLGWHRDIPSGLEQKRDQISWY